MLYHFEIWRGHCSSQDMICTTLTLRLLRHQSRDHTIHYIQFPIRALLELTQFEVRMVALTIL